MTDVPRSEGPLTQFVSPQADAPQVVLLGRTAGRMDEVVRLLRDAGGLSAYGAFTEADALRLVDTLPRLRVVLLGGGIDDPTRVRVRAYLLAHRPAVSTSEPGRQYPYSDENIVADVRAKAAAAR